MTARVSKEFSFGAGVHHDGQFIVNEYKCSMHMDVITEDIREQNVALSRMQFIIEEQLENCIFVSELDIKAVSQYKESGMRVCTLPEEPFDQIVAAVLLIKLNTIVEGKVVINEISILSKLCDGMYFHLDYSECGTLPKANAGWWTDNSPSICAYPKKNRGKVVEIRKERTGWIELGLDWRDPESTDNEITFHPEQT